MYHDQVLTPFKSLFQFDAINITLGLDYLRVSPDHGPAKDIINKNKANHLSLLKSINLLIVLINELRKKISWAKLFNRFKYSKKNSQFNKNL